MIKDLQEQAEKSSFLIWLKREDDTWCESEFDVKYEGFKVSWEVRQKGKSCSKWRVSTKLEASGISPPPHYTNEKKEPKLCFVVPPDDFWSIWIQKRVTGYDATILFVFLFCFKSNFLNVINFEKFLFCLVYMTIVQ